MDRARTIQAAFTLAADADTAAVVGALRGDGVDPILLKGPVVGRLLHPGRQLRTYADIDLMVGPDDVDRAEATLRALGYEPELPPLPPEPPRHAVGWSHPRRRPVDLHRRLHLVLAPPERIWEVVRRDAVEMEVAGTPVLVPGLAIQALHLALHAAASGHVVTRSVSDLDQAVVTLPRAVWNDAAAVAAELGALDAFGGGLSLCSAGARLAEELGVPTGGTKTMQMWQATTQRARPWTIELLADQPTLRAAMEAVGRRCFPPPAHVRPVGGRPGAVSLALGYGLRLARIAAHLPGSIAAWARLSGRPTRRR